jgi:hypothetical protein
MVTNYDAPYKRIFAHEFAAHLRHSTWPLGRPLALALAVASGASRLAFNNDYRVFFSDDNPQMLAFEELQHTYTKVDNILFTFVPKEGEVFDPRVLDAWQLPFALRVDSITNYQHTEATEDDLVVADLIDGGAVYDAQALERARNIAINEPLLRDFIDPHDGTVTGVNITFQMPQKSMDEVPEAVAAARELVARIEAEYPVDIHLTGMVMLNNSFFEMSMRDMGTLIPAMYLVIIIVAYLMLRSLRADDHHDARRGRLDSHSSHHARSHALSPAQTRGPQREFASQPRPRGTDDPHHGNWLFEHEFQRFAALCRPGQHNIGRRVGRPVLLGGISAGLYSHIPGQNQSNKEPK